MARDGSDEVPFSELERDFFEAAPPDVAQPPPEPMRFDDLDPVAPAQPERRAILVRARKVTAKARTALQSAAGAARDRGVPVFSRVRQRSTALWAATWRASTSAAKVAAREGRAQVARVFAMIRNSPREHRLIAAGVAALIVVTGVSAGVVASRGAGAGAGHAAAPAIPPVVASVVPGACETPPVTEPAPEPAAPEPVAATPTATADETPALGEPIPPATATPAQRKRKREREQAKAPAQPAAVRTKAPAGTPGVPPSSARPVFSR